MSFLNASLIFGTLAIAVPIVLHLIARREPRRVVFPSVRLLTQRFQTNRSKLRVRRWWLLALRILAIAAMAVALARPAIHRSLSITWLTIGLIAAFGIGLLIMASVAIIRGQNRSVALGLSVVGACVVFISITWGALTAFSGKKPPMDQTSPVALVILLDNSPTSQWKSGDDDRIERMKAYANELVATAPPTSRIAIVDRSATPPAFSLDVAGAISMISQLKPIETPQRIVPRLNASRRLLEQSELATRHVVLVTDRSKSTFSPDQNELPSIEKPFGDDSAIGLSILDLGPLDGINRSVSLPFVSDETPPGGTDVSVSATVSANSFSADSASSSESQSVTVELRVYQQSQSLPVIRDGEVVRPQYDAAQRRSIDVAPDQPVEVALNVPPLKSGQYHCEIGIVGEDALALDDKAFFTLNILPAQRLLIVGDIEEESYEIARMITEPLSVDDPNGEFAIERISFDDLAVVRLGDFAGIMLLDPPRDVLAEESLSQYVAGGGNIFACLGNAAGNEPLSIEGAPNLVRRWSIPEPGSFFQTVSTSHPVLEIFSVVTDGVPWLDYRVHQYWQIDKRPNDLTILNFAGTNHPALIETIPENSSTGRWMILATPVPDLSFDAGNWNELFGELSWPAFYLVRSLAQRVCGRAEISSTTTVGTPLQLRVPLQSSTDESDASVRMQLFVPGKSTPVPIDVAPNDSRVDESSGEESTPTEIVIRDVPQSGTYWMRGGRQNIGFSANIPRQRLDLNRVDADVLDTVLGEESYEIIEAVADVHWQDRQSETRIQLRSPMLLFALIVFLLEHVLANRFYRARPAA